MEPVQQPGGGAPPPGGDPPKPEGGGAPAYVTEEQLQAALTTRFRAFEQKFDRALSDGVGTIATRVREELAGLLPKREPAAEGGEGAPKPEGAGGGAVPGPQAQQASPELRKLQEQITLLTRQAEEARSERDAERARARDSLLRQRVTEALSGVGIEGVRARHALGLLVDAERRVRWSDDGDSILFRTDAHDELDLAGGVREWLKSEDAKLYLPPRGAAGSGDRPGAQPPPARQPAGPVDRATVAEGLRRALLGQL
jgi:hypothetical protein